MNRCMAMLGMALLVAGCAADDFEDGEAGQEGAATESPVEPVDAENVGEAAQAFTLGDYSASNTNSASNEGKVVKFPLELAPDLTVMIGTDGIMGAYNQGNTYLRLFAPTGDQVKANDDYEFSNDYGSRLSYTSSYNVTKTFTLWAGCQGDSACGPNKIRVSRMKGIFSFNTSNTNDATRNTAKAEYSVAEGRWIRASTCGEVATRASFSGDTFLRLFRKDGGTYFQVKSNDDTSIIPCGYSSTILYQVPSDGVYQVRAGCFENTACSGTVAVYAE